MTKLDSANPAPRYTLFRTGTKYRSGHPGDLGDRVKKALFSLGELPRMAPVLRRGGDFQATFDGLWKHFINCILHDLPSQCTLEDGRSGLRVALAAVQSLRSGAAVRLPPEAGG